MPLKQKADIYDCVSKKIIAEGVEQNADVCLDADTSAVLVLLPCGVERTVINGKMTANGIIVDYKHDVSAYGSDVCIPAPHIAFRKTTQVSSQTGEQGGGESALDGDWRSSWVPTADDKTPWLKIDFGEMYTVDKIKIRCQKNRHPQKYHIETSVDGADLT